MATDKILVTGANGKTGSSVVRELLARGASVRALVRKEAAAEQLRTQGVEVVLGDVADDAALARAMAGATKVAIILPNGEPQLANEKRITDAAVAARLRHIVKASSLETDIETHNPIHLTHRESERYIKASGVAWTMIRPSFYNQNFFGNAASIKAQHRFSLPMGPNGAAPMTDVRDAGAAIAEVLARPGHEGKTWEITGPEILSFVQVAEVFSRELGFKVEYVDQDPASYKTHLGQFVKNPWHLNAVCDIFAEIAAGYRGHTSDGVQRLLGRAPITFTQFVRDHKVVFAG